MEKSRGRIFSIICLLVWPCLIWGIYQFSDPTLEGQAISIFGLLILMILVALFPIQLPLTNLSLIQGVQLAIFLSYGLFYEAVLSQIAILLTVYCLRTSFKNHTRYTSNLMMFLIISISSSTVFYLLGGEVGSLGLKEYPKLVPIIGYMVTSIIVNFILVYIIRKKVFHAAMPQISEFVTEAVVTFIVLPIGVILYILHSQIGPLAILYVGIPYIISVFIVNLYHSTQKINDLLQETSKIGHELTESFDVNEILDTFMDRLTKLLDVDNAYIIDVPKNINKLEVVRIISEEPSILGKQFLEKGKGISGKVLRTGESLRYDKRSQWRKLSNGFLPLSAQSIICVPMKRNQEIVGVVKFVSSKKFAYKKYHLMIVEILSNYLAVAIDKARNYSETKQMSERCQLTNLYNYRFFEKHLIDYFATESKGPFSVVMIDLDHFKQINDTFGHQSGNAVLRELANRLRQFCDKQDLIARYGGEEFIILLHNSDQREAYLFAEKLRNYIAKNGFFITNDLSNRHTDRIYLTASIGVATAPDQGNDPLTLIRNADRAMYIGAKQQGRNKVASYVG